MATIVGFYAVSIPFFTKDHPLLLDDHNGERLRVSKNYQQFFFFFFSNKIFTNKIEYLLIKRLIIHLDEC